MTQCLSLFIPSVQEKPKLHRLASDIHDVEKVKLNNWTIELPSFPSSIHPSVLDYFLTYFYTCLILYFLAFFLPSDSSFVHFLIPSFFDCSSFFTFFSQQQTDQGSDLQCTCIQGNFPAWVCATNALQNFVASRLVTLTLNLTPNIISRSQTKLKSWNGSWATPLDSHRISLMWQADEVPAGMRLADGQRSSHSSRVN